MDHELSRHNITTAAPITATGNSDADPDIKEEDDDSIEESHDIAGSPEFGTEFTLRRAKLNEQLQVSPLTVWLLRPLWWVGGVSWFSSCLSRCLSVCFSLFLHPAEGWIGSHAK